MDITVDRTNGSEGNLVFTITVSKPHHSCFDVVEKNIMGVLDFCKSGIENLSPEDNRLRQDVIALIHLAKEKTFERVLNNLKFSIRNDLQPKFDPICQEIYNWIYDSQESCLKEWMSEFNPQRTQYYFDNDIRMKSQFDKQESENDIEIDDQDEDEDE